MNIKEAKQQIFNTLRAYLERDELGNYLISPVRQRPVLIMGPPGIGKTQIMEQIASEAGVGLVAYTMTHHTRQSAIGLPVLEKRVYGGQEITVTEYTMSEILASVWTLMEKTGIREGILFLDEINCVSETLAPMMLQFLQCKTFGNQRLPEGWLIVAAGNPPEYNRSVREFDVVTLDRVRRIDVEADYAVWREYAVQKNLHPAVTAYLDIHRDYFYRIETTAGGVQYVTARGWEDLSELLYVHERLGLPVDRNVTGQYLRISEIANDFANYLDLWKKYSRSYDIPAILQGNWMQVAESELCAAPFDERLSVIAMLCAAVRNTAGDAWLQNAVTEKLYGIVKKLLDGFQRGEFFDLGRNLHAAAEEIRLELAKKNAAGQNGGDTQAVLQRTAVILENYENQIAGCSTEDMAECLRTSFSEEPQKRLELGEKAAGQLGSVFRYLENAVGESQEMVLFVTELTAGFYTSWLIESFGCDAYYRHNRALLADDSRDRIARELAALSEKSHE